MIFFNDSDAFGANVPWHSVGWPWSCSQARGVHGTFQESILTFLCQNDSAPPQPSDQHESLGAVVLLEVLDFPESGGFDEQFMRQSTDEGAFKAGREL